MDEKILNNYEMQLLQIPKREMQLDGSIKEIYNQPERSKREDCKCPVVERWTTGNPPNFLRKEIFCRCGALNSMET